MGGRGASGTRSNAGAIGTKKPLEVENLGQKHMQGRTTWEKNIFEANIVPDEKGVIDIQYPKMDFEQISRNKVKATTKLKAGIIENKKGYEEHNINWDKVTEVRGKTYDIKDLIKKKGFRWNKEKGSWTK
ncbi:MAG: hypothetical protein ACLTKT_03350 [Clostridia bacterium]